jgi:hypothetical protein
LRSWTGIIVLLPRLRRELKRYRLKFLLLNQYEDLKNENSDIFYRAKGRTSFFN